MKSALAVCAVILPGLVSTRWIFCGPGFKGPGTSLKLENGSTCMVTQDFNHWSEPQAVHF